MSLPVSLDDGRDVLSACEAVVASASSALDEGSAALAERERARDVCQAAVAAAADVFDRDSTPEKARRLNEANAALSNAQLLVARATERLAQARGSVETARAARARAKRDVRVAELLDRTDMSNVRKALEGPAGRWLAAFDALLAAGKDIDHVLASDTKAAAELSGLGVHTRPLDPLHGIIGVLGRIVDREELALPESRGGVSVFRDVMATLVHGLSRPAAVLEAIASWRAAPKTTTEQVAETKWWLETVAGARSLADAMAIRAERDRERTEAHRRRNPPAMRVLNGDDARQVAHFSGWGRLNPGAPR